MKDLYTSSVFSTPYVFILVILIFGEITGLRQPYTPPVVGCIPTSGSFNINDREDAVVLLAADYQVTNMGSSYQINGVTQPTLTVTRGQPYTFSLSVNAVHPFFIRSSVNGANYSGFTSQGQVSGEQVLLVPLSDATSQLVYVCGVHGAAMSGTINIVDPTPLLVSPKVFLSGPYGTGPLMSDALRSQGHVPLTEPYSASGYVYEGDNNSTTSAPVLGTTGNNAIVDWVLVELRSGASSSTISGSRSALVQRDGDVVDTDGVSPVSFPGLPNGAYYVAIRHRSHLAAMTAAPRNLSTLATTVDLTSPATATHGTNAQQTIGSITAMWSGNVNGNTTVNYLGINNDRQVILNAVGATSPNVSVSSGYHQTDVNMNGPVNYLGINNDRQALLNVIGATTPNAARTQQLP